jgi:hypothetical protein
MFALSYSLAAVFYRVGQEVFPTNLLIRRLRTRAGLRWGLPVVVVGYGYFYAAGGLLALIEAGHGDWLSLPAWVCIWNGMKLVFGGLFVTLKLPYVRAKENLAVRRALREYRAEVDRAERLAMTADYRSRLLADRDTFV